MADASPVADRRIHRRIVLEAAAAMAAAGPAVLLGGHAEAQPPGGATALFAFYAVHSDLDEVSAYAIDKTGRITALNRQSCGGKNPVHLSIDPTGRWIITANYTAGSVGVVPIEKDGTLGPRADLVTLQGEPGPDRVRQASSHPHEGVFDPSGRFLAVPDLGFDRIFVFRLDAASGSWRRTSRRSSPRANAPARGTSRFIRRCRSRTWSMS